MSEVKSGNIKKVGYDQTSKTLRVQFSSGKEYDYSDVTPEEHAAFVGAESIGKHFYSSIRGVKSFSKIEQEKENKQ